MLRALKPVHLTSVFALGAAPRGIPPSPLIYLGSYPKSARFLPQFDANPFRGVFQRLGTLEGTPNKTEAHTTARPFSTDPARLPGVLAEVLSLLLRQRLRRHRQTPFAMGQTVAPWAPE